MLGPDPRFFARPCHGAPSLGGSHGWAVPYRRAEGFNACEAVVNLYVLELGAHGAFMDIVPFVIDTGTDVSIVPRTLLGPESFRGKELEVHDLIGFAGTPFVARRYRAALAIAARRPEPASVCFGAVDIFVVDAWNFPHAALGLDALRRVVLISDSKQVSFWPASAISRAADARGETPETEELQQCDLATSADVQRTSWEAFRSQLPRLLQQARGRWVAFRGQTQVALCASKQEVYEQLTNIGCPLEEAVVRRIAPLGPPLDLRRIRGLATHQGGDGP